MDHLSRISIFVEVVRRQSFAKAADHLGITPSAVSKQIMNLEDGLRVKLLNRTTRSLSLTDEGAIFFERAARAVDDLREVKSLIQDRKSSPVGIFKISAPESFGRNYLTEPLALFACQYEGLSMEIDFDDRMVDIIEEGYDVVLRIGALADSSLVARKLISMPLLLCASPAYIEKKGLPTTPNDLKDHDVIAYSRHGGVHEWRYKNRKTNVGGNIALHGRLRANTAEMMRQAALDGLGIAILPIFAIHQDLKTGSLVRLLPDFQTDPERNLYAIFPKNRYLSNKTRLFIDFLSNYCNDLPWT